MAMHYDNVNHNSYPDGCTLRNCTFVHVGEGTTGTITNVNYAEIGEDNTITISGVNYLTIGGNNTNVNISNANYIIVGNDNTNVTIGSHSQGSGLRGTGANSIVVTRETYGTEITGMSTQIHKTKYTNIDGYFNKIDFSKNILVNQSNGNNLNHSTVINLERTNNNNIEATYMELKDKQPFYEYNLINRVITAAPVVAPVNRQSDNTGVILDMSLNTLINKNDLKSDVKKQYTKVNGQWAEINTIK
jgi:hypothetical protein